MSQQQSPNAAPGARIDMKTVRRLFEQPQRIAGSAFLRQEIAARMRERLALVRLAPALIVDAGCGDGTETARLQQEFSQARVLGFDASLQLLQMASNGQKAAGNALRRWLAAWQAGAAGRGASGCLYASGDFAALPLASRAADLIWSNLALHWHPRPETVFAEWRRVLKTDGLLMFSCFGPDTFKELRAAFAMAGDQAAVLDFTDMHDFGDMLVHTGFSTPVMDMETITLTYPDAGKLLSDVRALGGNPLASRRKSLAGKGFWQRVRTELEATRRSDGRIHLTVEVVYGHAFLPPPRTTHSGEAIIRFDRNRPA